MTKRNGLNFVAYEYADDEYRVSQRRRKPLIKPHEAGGRQRY